MIRVQLLAGSIGLPVDDVVESIKRAYPSKRVVTRERREETPMPDRNRIQVMYDSASGIVYELQEG